MPGIPSQSSNPSHRTLPCALIPPGYDENEKRKNKGKLRQLTSGFYFFNMFCLQVCQSLKFEQERGLCRIMWFSLLIGLKDQPPQEGLYFMDLYCLDSVLAQCIKTLSSLYFCYNSENKQKTNPNTNVNH